VLVVVKGEPSRERAVLLVGVFVAPDRVVDRADALLDGE